MKIAKVILLVLTLCLALSAFVGCASSDGGMTVGQKNALKKAELYLRTSSFSRESLITQLEFEGFEKDDIIFAVDNVEVDWNEQCYKKAEGYLKYMAFSKQGLADQLEFEGFTSSQISYALSKVGYGSLEDEADENESNLTIGQKNALNQAESYLKTMAFSRQGLINQLEYEGYDEADILFAVDNVKVDWNEQCYKKAQSYLQVMSFSKQSLIQQLEYEGFTDSQISYAISKLGY